MIHEIDDSVLSGADRQILARLLAAQSAALADLEEMAIQEERRRLIDSAPNPTSEYVLSKAELDRTTKYVPGQRRRRRIVPLTPPTAPPSVTIVATEQKNVATSVAPRQIKQTIAQKCLAIWRSFIAYFHS